MQSALRRFNELHRDPGAPAARPGTRWLESWLQIEARITGRHPPAIAAADLAWLDAAFHEVERAFIYVRIEGTAPTDDGDSGEGKRRGRKPAKGKRAQLRYSNPQYNFVISRLLELRGLVNLAVYFPTLKSKDKVRRHDDWWRKICAINRWQYISSFPDPLWLRLSYCA